jgi:hypothetical protein
LKSHLRLLFGLDCVLRHGCGGLYASAGVPARLPASYRSSARPTRRKVGP